MKLHFWQNYKIDLEVIQGWDFLEEVLQSVHNQKKMF